ncbi:DUF488 domain-containing protein [Geomesophilobacter sediminis]|uniref:DUF488 domain-containing protein n=1 Tax=Geomesophilobacter sediminis TaxID=2798584 RepID=A0A8J7LYF5_9BACT|nr:DUF488 domain-containing protein [Geomesophilobacter sediminis]MBJ6724981.1 DUF488 domain-containing protein [Geomesophilobacter sediminis]
MIQIKRVYEAPGPEDGRRLLVDRLWPRGLSREEARLDGWLKEIAPSDELRRWFGHDPERWEAFQSRYRAELESVGAVLDELCQTARREKVTLLYAAKDEAHNNAVVLKDFIEARMAKR